MLFQRPYEIQWIFEEKEELQECAPRIFKMNVKHVYAEKKPKIAWKEMKSKIKKEEKKKETRIKTLQQKIKFPSLCPVFQNLLTEMTN